MSRVLFAPRIRQFVPVSVAPGWQVLPGVCPSGHTGREALLQLVRHSRPPQCSGGFWHLVGAHPYRRSGAGGAGRGHVSAGQSRRLVSRVQASGRTRAVGRQAPEWDRVDTGARLQGVGPGRDSDDREATPPCAPARVGAAPIGDPGRAIFLPDQRMVPAVR